MIADEDMISSLEAVSLRGSSSLLLRGPKKSVKLAFFVRRDRRPRVLDPVSSSSEDRIVMRERVGDGER